MVGPTTMRPNQLIRIAATIFRLEYDTFTVVAAVRKFHPKTEHYEEICSGSHTFHRAGTHEIVMMVSRL